MVNFHIFILLGQRPVDQEQIEVVCLQIFERLLAGGNCIFKGMHRPKELGSDKQVMPAHAALLDSLARLHFVFINGRRIDMPIPRFYGPFDRIFRIVVLCLPNAKAQPGHQNTVGQPSHIVDRL